MKEGECMEWNKPKLEWSCRRAANKPLNISQFVCQLATTYKIPFSKLHYIVTQTYLTRSPKQNIVWCDVCSKSNRRKSTNSTNQCEKLARESLRKREECFDKIELEYYYQWIQTWRTMKNKVNGLHAWPAGQLIIYLSAFIWRYHCKWTNTWYIHEYMNQRRIINMILSYQNWYFAKVTVMRSLLHTSLNFWSVTAI